MLTPPALHQSRFPMSRLSLTAIGAVSDQLDAIGQLTVIKRRNQLARERTQIGVMLLDGRTLSGETCNCDGEIAVRHLHIDSLPLRADVGHGCFHISHSVMGSSPTHAVSTSGTRAAARRYLRLRLWTWTTPAGTSRPRLMWPC